ncbi:MAG: type IV pilus twitching motility protein PilT [Planctomycetes bacterium]|nr:type IV pilus twitching motility protein PilT [Planctomycetota bacterium]
MEFHEMLRKMVIEKASDLFIKVGTPPSLRVDGDIAFLDTDEITPQDSIEIFEIIEDSKKEGFSTKNDIDVAYEVPGIGRFRVNIFRQRGHIGFVLRHIESNVPSFEELCLPGDILKRLAAVRRGLVLVTGNTGSGKSTTLAAMINYVNENFNRHVVTIEDPIEFIFKDRKSLLEQREIGTDTPDFHTALKMAVRQSPDVILIGEMRDRETMEAALSAAETGHLVFSTLHTVNASQTVERIINYFPPHQHNLIRLQLSLVLKGVVSQRLLPRKSESGRVPAVEILVESPTISEILYEGRTHELYGALKEGSYYGCQTFNQSLKVLYQDDLITLDHAMEASDFPDELKLELKGIYKGTMTADFNFNY